ncbi:MAG: lipid A deacylase LpxR family protein [Rickettsiales bacterium]
MINSSIIKLISCAVAIQITAIASLAHAEETLEEQASEEILKEDKTYYATLTVENDLFGAGTDQNYTNGIRLSWFELGEKPPAITKDLEHIWPFLDINDTTSVSYSLGHNLYTPNAVGSATQDPNDRPWAAFLYGSMGMTTLAENHIDEYEITLGIIGPAALGKPIQKTVHDIIDSTDPKGWDNQLKNEPGLMLSWQRRWPEAWRANIKPLFMSFTPHAGITAGNIYTYANAGGTIKISPKERRWADKPLSVRPSIPGTGYFPSSDSLGWEIFIGTEGRAIARNIFLDGNTFSNSHSVDKKHLVMDANAGVAFTFGQTRLSYTLVYRTKEFDGQDDEDLFGAISVGYNF